MQQNLARCYAKLDALKLLNWRSAWSLEAGHPNMAEASAVKVMGSEFFVECYRLLLEITGAAGAVVAGEPGCMFGGFLEQAYRGATTLTFGGGVNEIQRDIIAMAGLGLPAESEIATHGEGRVRSHAEDLRRDGGGAAARWDPTS